MAEVRLNTPLYKVTMTEYERGYGQRDMGEKFFDNEEDRAVAELVIAQQLFGRPYIAPPGVPDAIVAILRAAFLAALNDPALIADAERSQIDLAPAGGERVQDGVRKIYAAPANIVERAREAIRR